MFQKNEKLLKFEGRTKSKNGVLSLTIGIIVWIIFLALSLFSSGMEGNAGNPIGIIAILDVAFAATGFTLAIRGLKERDVFYGLQITGAIFNGLAILVLIYLYLVGITIE